ncbi:hypothetical protein TMatcc_010832 [Talaromyces marneffei ATCC 18224]|uniref:Uncharacterized protein n=2 Tax=Talaromyces marneffei TaxID=37727 RepID=B6QUG5_TALMQ|nr:uncharacterized protein EYB26_009411 [Talaromyces marneffei]EEA18624.1 conserved hypothetical protein [Talaromyces marneffei ATCC 18224]KAE8548358.1 hypothetical protein EYB25_008736 [Talaromyces marneffei]QGA21700.1 hypothetical protein EYB26_009411 [Talaromyces marneffei]
MSSNKSQNHTAPEIAQKDEQPTTTTTTTTANQNKENQPCLLSRIQNSASTLVQETLTRPSGATLPSDLAHVLNSGNKGSSSYTPSGSSGQTWSSADPRGSRLSPGAQDGYASGMSNGFRSTHLYVSDGTDQEIDSFQNAGFFNTVDDLLIATDEGEAKGKGKSREPPISNDWHHEYGQGMTLDINDEYESTHFNAYELAWINASRLGTVYRSTTSTPSKRLSQSSEINPVLNTTAQTQMEDGNDGAEVVALLSNPSFQPGLVTWAHNENQGGMVDGLEPVFDLNDDPFDTEGFPLAIGLSPAEMQMIDMFRRQQPQHQQDQETHEKEDRNKRITANSLVPDIDSILSTAATNKHEALREAVITNLVGAEEWLHVDQQYNEDVWGYLKPAVEAAAAELQQKEENPVKEGVDGDGPAVKRLRMILRHMARL